MHYLGCYNADEIVHLNIAVKRPVVFISNILPTHSSLPMGHWVCIYVNIVKRQMYFFDSYAMSPETYGHYFVEFIKSNKITQVYTMHHRLQSDFSLACGLYCIMFVHRISHLGLPSTLSYLRNVFSRETLKLNDKRVLTYARRYFPMKQPCVRTFCKGLGVGSYRWCRQYFC